MRNNLSLKLSFNKCSMQFILVSKLVSVFMQVDWKYLSLAFWENMQHTHTHEYKNRGFVWKIRDITYMGYQVVV